MENNAQIHCVYKRHDVLLRDLAQIANDNGKHLKSLTDHIWISKLQKITIDINKLIDISKLKNAKSYTCSKIPCLSIACRYASAEMVRNIIALQADPSAQDFIGNTALHAACRSKIDTIEKIQLLLKINPSLVKIRNHNDTLPVHIAAIQKSPRALKTLLKYCYGGEVNFATKLGLTSLHISADRGHVDNIRELLKRRDISVNARDVYGDTASHHAACYGHFDAFVLLQSHPRIDRTIRNDQGKTAEEDLSNELRLFYHALCSPASKLTPFLRGFAEVPCDKEQNTVLHFACTSNIQGGEKTRMILERNPSLIRGRNSNKDLPLHKAAANKDGDVLKAMLEINNKSTNHCISVNAPNRQGATALHFAVANKIWSNVAALLNHDLINVNARNADGDTPAHLAALNEDNEILKLIESNTEFNRNIKNKSLKTCYQVHPLNSVLLHFAKNGSVRDMEKVLEREAKLIRDENDNNGLHLACMSNTDVREKINMLLKIDVSLLKHPNSEGLYPLHIAVRNNNTMAIVALLMNSNSDINIQDSRNQTPLHHAVDCNLDHIVDYLLCKDLLNVNAQDNQGNTAAHLAGQQRRNSIISRIMFHRKFDIGLKNIWGQQIWCPHGKLSDVWEQTWHEHKSIDVVISNHLALIKGRLFCCGYNNDIHIYDLELKHIGSIYVGEMESVRAVIELANHDLVLAARMGLYHYSHSGEFKEKILAGEYRGVTRQNNKVYASHLDYSSWPPSTCIDIHDSNNAWRIIEVIRLPCNEAHFVSLTSTKERIFACCRNEGIVYELSHSGCILYTHGKQGHGDAGELWRPATCHCDVNGALLLADRMNDRMQVLHDHSWSVLNIKPLLAHPRCAVYIPSRLYILCWNKHKIRCFYNYPFQSDG